MRTFTFHHEPIASMRITGRVGVAVKLIRGHEWSVDVIMGKPASLSRDGIAYGWDRAPSAARAFAHHAIECANEIVRSMNAAAAA